MAAKTQFGSKIGLIAATVGSAVGLGNVWRFPAETQANGGAAFLIIYIICICLLGIPVMLAEFALGRGTGKDALGAFRKLAPRKRWWLTGALALLASYLILSFYMVVAAWTLEYLWQSVTGDLYTVSKTGVESIDMSFRMKMNEYISESWRPLIATFVIIGINIFVLMKGVQKGIEKMSNIMMPVLFMLLLIFAAVSLSFPKAGEGLAYFFHPDFSKITPAVVINALGQAFFSLSLGMGILITYSAYFPKKTNLITTAVTVSALDLVVALLMGIIIFPAVMTFGLDGESLEGATLVFVTLPEVFSSMPLTRLWSSLFFLLLLVAALTSTISLAEVSTAYAVEKLGWKRKKSCLAVMLPLFPLSALCSLSQGVLNHIRILGQNIFDFFDTIATNLMLPAAAILTCIFIGWIIPRKYFRGELTNHGKTNKLITKAVIWVVRYPAPILIAVILVAKMLE
ncbi:MAG: sodium-dependent transporter [Muribaculaceae bacterium]|nr:sodium-dependent transporter [Muribaculaceae bacterium]